MHIYKALQPIQLLSFDLDDTLYDNKPVIAAAEQAMLAALHQLAPQCRHTDSDFWWQHRLQLARQTPAIRHDIGRWRLLGIEAGLVSLGLSRNQAETIAGQAFAAFLQQRTNISLHPAIVALLRQLAQHYRLIAITNGNAQVAKMGVGDLFEFSLQAGPDGRMKPYSDLFLRAADQANVAPGAILHIGDSHRADVLGALNAGCQAAWLDLHRSNCPVLPHIHCYDIQALGRFLLAKA